MVKFELATGIKSSIVELFKKIRVPWSMCVHV